MTIQNTKVKILILVGVIGLTVAIHYGFVLEHIFGHAEWVHALHSRFCYLPIMISAAWFGLRGGVLAATVIAVAIMPYLFGAVATNPDHITSLSQELIEIFFYYSFGVLIGLLVDREMLVRRRHEQTSLELERSRRLSMVGQMAASVAHEIKNPLASIKGAVEIISEDSTPKKDRDEFRLIVAGEIKRIDGTVKEFLDFARPREPKRVRLNLSATLHTSLRQLEKQIADAGVSLRTEIQPDRYINGDAEKLHQVVLNLILNAIDASTKGLAIEVDLSRAQDGSTRLVIRDHGKGIDAVDLPNIFEPFYTTKSTGTGLGLAIVRSIVEAHAGTITAASPTGGGTAMTITLPSIN